MPNFPLTLPLTWPFLEPPGELPGLPSRLYNVVQDIPLPSDQQIKSLEFYEQVHCFTVKTTETIITVFEQKTERIRAEGSRHHAPKRP